MLITLGMINGGLGLKLSENTTKGEIGYGVIAGFFWLVWMVVAVRSELRTKGESTSDREEKALRSSEGSEEGMRSRGGEGIMP